MMMSNVSLTGRVAGSGRSQTSHTRAQIHTHIIVDAVRTFIFAYATIYIIAGKRGSWQMKPFVWIIVIGNSSALRLRIRTTAMMSVKTAVIELNIVFIETVAEALGGR